MSDSIRAFTPRSDAYARVFFPVTSEGPDTRTWSQAFATAPPTPDTAWPEERARSSSLNSASGDVPSEVASVLIDVLVRSGVARDEQVVLGWWSGYGDTVAPPNAHLDFLPPDDREMWLVLSRLDAIPRLTKQVGRGPTRWLPMSRSWSVVSDIYDRSVIVVGSTRLVDAVVSASGLEAVFVTDRTRRAVLS
ncbi:hypothetical protein EDF55_0040 [Curtobacterium sp. ZW137]|nr:hypothetical protein EDF55_0040 [Curtobacterium sp. ZW137]